VGELGKQRELGEQREQRELGELGELGEQCRDVPWRVWKRLEAGEAVRDN
jgi:hypothetical protein